MVSATLAKAWSRIKASTGVKSPDFDTWFATVVDLSHRLDDDHALAAREGVYAGSEAVLEKVAAEVIPRWR